MSVMMEQTNFLKLFHIQSKEIGKKSTTKEQQNVKIGKVRFRRNIDVRKEDARLNAIKQLITLVKGGLNFSCKSTTAAIVDLTESPPFLITGWRITILP